MHRQNADVDCAAWMCGMGAFRTGARGVGVPKDDVEGLCQVLNQGVLPVRHGALSISVAGGGIAATHSGQCAGASDTP